MSHRPLPLRRILYEQKSNVTRRRADAWSCWRCNLRAEVEQRRSSATATSTKPVEVETLKEKPLPNISIRDSHDVQLNKTETETPKRMRTPWPEEYRYDLRGRSFTSSVRSLPEGNASQSSQKSRVDGPSIHYKRLREPNNLHGSISQRTKADRTLTPPSQPHSVDSVSHTKSPSKIQQWPQSTYISVDEGNPLIPLPPIARLESFDNSGLPNQIIEALSQKFNISTPTQIQSTLLSTLQAYISACLRSPTGSGKSILLAVWALCQSTAPNNDSSGLKSLILVSGPDLAMQYGRWIRLLEGKEDSSTVQVLYRTDEKSEKHQLEKLGNEPNSSILIATPTRLLDILSSSKEASSSINFNHLKTIVLDEADELIPIERKGGKEDHAPPAELLLQYIFSQRHKNKAGKIQFIAAGATLTSEFRNFIQKKGWMDPKQRIRNIGMGVGMREPRAAKMIEHYVLVATVERSKDLSITSDKLVIRDARTGEQNIGRRGSIDVISINPRLTGKDPVHDKDIVAIQLSRKESKAEEDKLPQSIEYPPNYFAVSAISRILSYGHVKPGSSMIVIPHGASRESFIWACNYLGVRNVRQLRFDDPALEDENSGDIVWVTHPKDCRGIDIKGLRNVFILGLPRNGEEYVHMAGRVGRHAKWGRVWTILSDDDIKSSGLNGFDEVERICGERIGRVVNATTGVGKYISERYLSKNNIWQFDVNKKSGLWYSDLDPIPGDPHPSIREKKREQMEKELREKFAEADRRKFSEEESIIHKGSKLKAGMKIGERSHWSRIREKRASSVENVEEKMTSLFPVLDITNLRTRSTDSNFEESKKDGETLINEEFHTSEMEEKELQEDVDIPSEDWKEILARAVRESQDAKSDAQPHPSPGLHKSMDSSSQNQSAPIVKDPPSYERDRLLTSNRVEENDSLPISSDSKRDSKSLLNSSYNETPPLTPPHPATDIIPEVDGPKFIDHPSTSPDISAQELPPFPPQAPFPIDAYYNAIREAFPNKNKELLKQASREFFAKGERRKTRVGVSDSSLPVIERKDKEGMTKTESFLTRIAIGRAILQELEHKKAGSAVPSVRNPSKSRKKYHGKNEENKMEEMEKQTLKTKEAPERQERLDGAKAGIKRKDREAWQAKLNDILAMDTNLSEKMFMLRKVEAESTRESNIAEGYLWIEETAAKARREAHSQKDPQVPDAQSDMEITKPITSTSKDDLAYSQSTRKLVSIITHPDSFYQKDSARKQIGPRESLHQVENIDGQSEGYRERQSIKQDGVNVLESQRIDEHSKPQSHPGPSPEMILAPKTAQAAKMWQNEELVDLVAMWQDVKLVEEARERKVRTTVDVGR